MSLWLLGLCCCVVIAIPVLCAVEILPTDSRITLEGRYSSDEVAGTVEFDSPGFRITFSVNGASSVGLRLSSYGTDQPNRFWIFVDGTQSDVVIDTSQTAAHVASTYTFLIGSPFETHAVSIVKITEADWNNPYPIKNSVTLHSIFLDKGNAIAPPPQTKRNIEFIGDSITAGYCNMCKEIDPDSPGYMLESFAISWPYLVATALNATYHATAWSGFGLVRNCCGGNTHMPEVFARTILSDESSRWSLADWAADVVVINLGTNDNLNSSNPGEVERNFERTYVEFALNISAGYVSKNPVIFLACGPMSNQYCPYVFRVIETLTVIYGLPVYFLDHRNILTSDNQCCGHPDNSADKLMADIAIATISSVLNWKTD